MLGKFVITRKRKRKKREQRRERKNKKGEEKWTEIWAKTKHERKMRLMTWRWNIRRFTCDKKGPWHKMRLLSLMEKTGRLKIPMRHLRKLSKLFQKTELSYEQGGNRKKNLTNTWQKMHKIYKKGKGREGEKEILQSLSHSKMKTCLLVKLSTMLSAGNFFQAD